MAFFFFLLFHHSPFRFVFAAVLAFYSRRRPLLDFVLFCCCCSCCWPLFLRICRYLYCICRCTIVISSCMAAQSQSLPFIHRRYLSIQDKTQGQTKVKTCSPSSHRARTTPATTQSSLHWLRTTTTKNPDDVYVRSHEAPSTPRHTHHIIINFTLSHTHPRITLRRSCMALCQSAPPTRHTHTQTEGVGTGTPTEFMNKSNYHDAMHDNNGEHGGWWW